VDLRSDFLKERKDYMALKFRLRGLAETFVDQVVCPCCGHEVKDENDTSLSTEHTKVTLSGIVVVVQCGACQFVFIPIEQKFGVINTQRLQSAVERDSQNSGQPVFKGLSCVKVEVERINAHNTMKMH
jgi:hypothetical protein